MGVVERFVKYVSYDTQSDENSGTVPSTAKQRVLAEALADEMRDMGLVDVAVDDYGYVYGALAATEGCETLPARGLIAHMDTSPAVSGKEVSPRIIRYEGGDITLESGAVTARSVYPFLSRYEGEELIVTDGRTLLGADDKAGIAEILSACEYLLAHPELSHGRIPVAFTPDEEIGSGADHFDVARFAAVSAYTVDGGELGEIEYENFNAAGVKLTVHGVNIHPGSAKGRMKNAVLMANAFVSMLPPAEAPAHTEGYEGFYHVCDMSGDESLCKLSMIIRDHDRAKFEERKQFICNLVAYLNGVYGEGSFVLDLRDSYYNMKEMIEPHPELIETAKAAMEKAGVTPEILPIRGGTDGARLSFMGLPCPNLSTGGANFHGIHELIPVRSLEKMTEVLVNIMTA